MGHPSSPTSCSPLAIVPPRQPPILIAMKYILSHGFGEIHPNRLHSPRSLETELLDHLTPKVAFLMVGGEIPPLKGFTSLSCSKRRAKPTDYYTAPANGSHSGRRDVPTSWLHDRDTGATKPPEASVLPFVGTISRFHRLSFPLLEEIRASISTRCLRFFVHRLGFCGMIG